VTEARKEDRPGYAVLVLGSGGAPDDLVRGALDRLLGAKLGESRVTLLLSADEGPAGEWARGRDYCSVQVELVYHRLWPRRLAEARWALGVAAAADAVVVFGDDRPWWRVFRYLRDTAAPVRRVKVPPPPPARPG
jgi:hypothetical protein